MKSHNRIGWWVGGWTAVVTALHLGLNVDWASVANDHLPEARRRLNVAYIPVT